MEENRTIVSKEALTDGRVQIFYSDGFSYLGYVDAEGRPHGEGKLNGRGKEYWNGEFKDGTFVKGGVNVTIDKGDCIHYYEGGYANGLYSGEGALCIFKNGMSGMSLVGSPLEGTFQEGRLKKGTMSITDPSDNSSYVGETEDEKPHGFGKRREKNGTFSGIFENGKKKMCSTARTRVASPSVSSMMMLGR
jgi:hypothetical protein